jgi:hypothetical protein
MARGKSRQNNGPCVVCGQHNSEEKFRRLNENLLAKVKESPAAQQLTFELNLNDQLCQQHYNNFVVYDRGINKLQNKKRNADLSYHLGGIKQKISLSQETHECINASNTVSGELTQQIEKLEFQLNQIKKSGKFFKFIKLINFISFKY